MRSIYIKNEKNSLLSHILVIVLSFLLTFYFIRCKLFNIFSLILNDYAKILEFFFSNNINQEQKEKTLIKISVSLFSNSLKIIINFLIIFIFIYFFSIFDNFLIKHIFSLIGILESAITIICSHYLFKNYDKL